MQHHPPGSAAGADVYFLTLPIAGRGVATQRGRPVEAASGDLLLIDCDHPFRLDIDHPVEQLLVTIPKPCLDPLLAQPEVCRALHLPTDHGGGLVIQALVQTLAAMPQHLMPREAAGVSHHLVMLVALAVSEGVTREPVGRAALLQLAMDEIERSLADPDLTPDLIARRVSISVSYLTKLFAAHSTSVGRWLHTRRLDRAWSLLDPTRDDPRSVTEIAHACGFRDSAHFARAFRLRFDLTPSARRAHPRVAGSDRDQRR